MSAREWKGVCVRRCGVSEGVGKYMFTSLKYFRVYLIINVFVYNLNKYVVCGVHVNCQGCGTFACTHGFVVYSNMSFR